MKRAAIALATLLTFPGAANADDLFESQWASVASDRSAAHVGDILTVVVYQAAEARNAAQNTAHRRHSVEGSLRGGSIDESGDLSLDGAYAGQGEVRRSESFVTQISVVIEAVLPNGDFVIAGEQLLHVNGEETTVRVSGRVRPVDITAGNQILSTRIADAQISYDGEGFVSRNARPHLINRLLGLLGFGG